MNLKSAVFMVFVSSLAVSLISGCIVSEKQEDKTTSTASSTIIRPSTTTISETDGGGFLELHEWGVLAGCNASDSFFITGRPKQIIYVKQPVIYVHSRNVSVFDLDVEFKKGKPTDTYPNAAVSASKAVWSDVKILSEGVGCVAEKSKALTAEKEYASLEDILPKLRNVDSDCLSHSGNIGEPFLFYEGELEFQNRIDVSYNLGEDGYWVEFRNNGNYTVYNVFFTASEGGDFIHTKVYSAHTPKLEPGESKRLNLNKETPDAKKLAEDLTDLGFTLKEANSFASLWSQTFFAPSNIQKYANLIYRIPQDEYEKMITLNANPKPNKTVRILYVLVDYKSDTPP